MEVQPQQLPVVIGPPELRHQPKVPQQYVWPEEARPLHNPPHLDAPVIDKAGFLSGDPAAVEEAARKINEACRKHGFFLVKNHGVDPGLVDRALENMDTFFNMSLEEKRRAQKKPGQAFGYSSSFIGRFDGILPWKETLTFGYSDDAPNVVDNYFAEVMGEDFREFGRLYQEYCASLGNLGLEIMELLGASLGVERTYFRKFYEGSQSILRLNSYPECQQASMVLGTGPHQDPTSLTILCQDEVGGLEVFVDGQWQLVAPVPNTFVINIGDTFQAATNGFFKSCTHRAVVNQQIRRRSMAFFLNPRPEKVVAPPEKLVEEADNKRLYPDFTWPQFLEFTQKHYRSDWETLPTFIIWLKNRTIDKNWLQKTVPLAD